MRAEKRVTAVAIAAMCALAGAAAAEPAAAPEPLQAPAATAFGVGARIRYVTLPTWLLNLFLDHSTPMTSAGFGVEVVRRKANLDLVFGLEYENVSPEDGLNLEKGDNPGSNCFAAGECPDDVVFDGLGLVAFDASFIWHTDLAGPKVQLRYGGGIGLGLLLGDIIQHDTECPLGATVDDLDDRTACKRTGTFKTADTWPVWPVVQALLGIRVQVAPKITLNLDGGFRDMFFLGVGSDYVF